MSRILVPIVGTLAFVFSCSGESSTSLDDPRELVRQVVSNLHRQGMVFHARLEDGSEVWIDAENQQFRFEAPLEISEDRKWLGIGEGWKFTWYDPSSNQIYVRELQEEGGRSLLPDDPASYHLPGLSELLKQSDLSITADGRLEDNPVIVLEGKTVQAGGQDVAPGSQSVTHFEIGRESLLPVSYDEYSVGPNGEKYSGPPPYAYVQTEFIPRERLATGFFSPETVNEALVTIDYKLQKMRSAGLTPYWFGERLVTEYGTLITSEPAIDVAESWAELGYHLENYPPGAGNVSISMGDRFATGCRPLREGEEGEPRFALVEGKYGSMLVSHGSCPANNSQLSEFHGVMVKIDGKDVFLLATDLAGAELRNPFNNREAIIGLVDYLVPGPD